MQGLRLTVDNYLTRNCEAVAHLGLACAKFTKYGRLQVSYDSIKNVRNKVRYFLTELKLHLPVYGVVKIFHIVRWVVTKWKCHLPS